MCLLLMRLHLLVCQWLGAISRHQSSNPSTCVLQLQLHLFVVGVGGIQVVGLQVSSGLQLGNKLTGPYCRLVNVTWRVC
jgi:hypothetical protein